MQIRFTSLFFMLTMVLYSCSDTENRPEETDYIPEVIEQEQEKKEVTLSHELQSVLLNELPKDTSMIMFISDATVVFTIPDTTLIKNLIEEMGEEGFYSESDRQFYEQDKAAAFFQKKNIEVLFPKKRYLVFRDEEKQYVIDSQRNPEKAWLSIVFVPGNPPEIFQPEKAEKETEKLLK